MKKVMRLLEEGRYEEAINIIEKLKGREKAEALSYFDAFCYID